MIELPGARSNSSLDRDRPTEPQPEVVLYCQTRAGATDDRLAELEKAIGEIGYDLRRNDREDTLSIIVPVEEPGLDPDDVTRDDVYTMAQDLDIDGRSDMSKAELVEAVNARQ